MAAKGLRLATQKAPVYLVILQGAFITQPRDKTNLVRSGKRKRPRATPKAASVLAAALSGARAPHRRDSQSGEPSQVVSLMEPMVEAWVILSVEAWVILSIGPVAPSPAPRPPNCRFQVLCKSVRPRTGATPVRGFFTLTRSQIMDTTTLLIIIVVLLLLGGGWFGRGRWY